MSIFDLTIYILKFFIPSFFCVLFRAYGLGYKNKKCLIKGLVVFTAYVAIVPAVLILTIGYGEFTHVSTVVMTIGSMAVLIFTTDSIGKTIFLQLIQTNITTIVSVVLNMVRHTFRLSYFTLVLMFAVVSPLVYFFALKYWSKPMRFIADNIHAEVSSLIALPIVTMVVVYLIPIYPPQNFANHPIYCTFMMLAVECGFFLYIYTFYQNLLKIRRLLKQEAKGQLLEVEIASYHEYLYAAKQSRHDLRHHNAVLAEYIQNGENQQALQYLHTNDNKLSNNVLEQFCKNSTANAVLQIYNRQVQAEGITFVAIIDLTENLPIMSSELGALLSNLLENGVEACLKVPSVKRQISFYAQTDEGEMRLEIRNSVLGRVTFEDGFPVSTKVGGGMGTKSIAHIVEKYGGMLRFKQDGELFLTQIHLPLDLN